MFNWKSKGLLLAFVVLIADQLSKWWVVTQFLKVQQQDNFAQWLVQKSEQAAYVAKPITSFLNIVMVWNPGVSFGLMQTNTVYVFWALTAMALAVSLGFLVWLWRDPRPVRGVTVGLIVGGALGNVLDRIRYDAVIDFIDVYAGKYHWPAFNVADSAIVVGVVILLIETIFFSKDNTTR